MSMETLVRYWHRPSSQEEESHWEQLEQVLNARLLDDRERADALRHQRTGGDVFDIGMSLIGGIQDWLSELYENETQKQYLPGKGYFDQAAAVFTFLVGLSLLGTIPLLGVASAGYELYRLCDRIVHKARRPAYYDTEAKKRFEKIQAQRSQSHRIRHRSSLFYPPAPSELVEAWARANKRGNVRDKLRLGAQMAIVEAAVNNDLIRDETGAIVGRNPGVRGWLKVNCSELLPHYKSLMHYKAMADKEQVVCGLSDPFPAEVLFAEPFPMAEKGDETATRKENAVIEIMVGSKSCWSENRGRNEVGERIEIMVGPESGKGGEEEAKKEKLVMRGVRQGMGEKLRTESEEIGSTLFRARNAAASFHAMAEKSHATSSCKQYEDLLFSQLGLVREIRVRPRRCPKSRHLPRKAAGQARGPVLQ